jgi:hypothetical protein
MDVGKRFLAYVVPRLTEIQTNCLKAGHIVDLWIYVQAGFESGDMDPLS